MNQFSRVLFSFSQESFDLTDKTPLERAKLLETTPLFSKIHAEMASKGQTPVRPGDLQTDLHFVCFVEAPDADFRDRAAQSAGAKLEGDATEDNGSGKRLIELDGTRTGPVDRGECRDLLKVPVSVSLWLEAAIESWTCRM